MAAEELTGQDEKRKVFHRKRVYYPLSLPGKFFTVKVQYTPQLLAIPAKA